MVVKRYLGNPILTPNRAHLWEAEASFNPSVVEKDGLFYLLYRATSERMDKDGVVLEMSSIGCVASKNGLRFKDRRQVIFPEKDWEKFGCEDPRITEFEGRYYIFYTAISKYPFSAEGIRIGLAITSDFVHFEKHPVTNFNSKAMALFPERINGKIAAILAVNTDVPPAKICVALFDKIEDIWSEKYWDGWRKDLDSHVISFAKGEKDHLEVGSQPLKTEKGWLIFYSYIYNYFSPPPVFGIQAALLELNDPRKIIGEMKRPFLVPDEEYELYGKVPSVVFPSGALLKKKNVYLYYGAADTTCCLATLKLKDLLENFVFTKKKELLRYENNPILEPISEHEWESQAVFNPGAIYEGGKVSLLYRAMSDDNTSVLGYASSSDGIHIGERLPLPAYVPREDFELKAQPGNSGCEDPRLTCMNGNVYMCYTAFNGKDKPQVAFVSIALDDFLKKEWKWSKSVLISDPGIGNKDAALFPRKIKGKYVFLHRSGGSDIWIDFLDDLNFDGKKFLRGKIFIQPRETAWDSKLIGISAPPIETSAGWLLLYHGVSRRTNHYNVRAAILDLENPEIVLYRTRDPILAPKTDYEKNGIVPNVVFPCGAVVIKGELFVYYGGGDKVVGVAKASLKDLIGAIVHEAKYHRA